MNFFHFFGAKGGTGFGCIALEPLEAGEVILKVPFEDCVWPIDESEDQFKNLLISLKRVYLDSNNKWFDYLDNIHKSGSLNDLPIMSGQVCGTSSVSNLFKILVSPYLDDITIPNWLVALGLSRCFDSECRSEGIAFVPFADQFNHSTPNWNTRLREEDDHFIFYAERRIEANEEILNNYGIDTTVEMWTTHGFIDDGLIEDIIYIPLSFLRESDILNEDGEDVILRINVNSKEVIPNEINELFVLKDFLPKVADCLIRAMDRMVNDNSGSSSNDVILNRILEQDKSNCLLYRKRLVEYRENLDYQSFLFLLPFFIILDE